MRSRYSAYALGRLDYLLDTWHPSTRPAGLDALPPELKWLGLQVRRHACTGPTGAEVEFVARSKWGGKARRLHESSRFVLEGGQWWYVDGQVR
jgi:SEC-C motif-containing protein